MQDYIFVNDNQYLIVSFLGKGKSGYSYLATKDNQYFVLKQIHHEPCDYYQFGDKLNAEINAYHRLLEIKIPIPKLIEIDYSHFTSKEKLESLYESKEVQKYFKDNYDIEDYFPTVVVISMLGNSEYKDVEFDYLSLDFNFTNIDILLGV